MCSGVTKKLNFVAILEDRDYDVVLIKRKALLKYVATIKEKRVGVQVKNIYKLEVNACVTLRNKVEHLQSRDVRELRHRCMGHIHHGALKIMR